MNQPTNRRDEDLTTQDLAEDATCPNCDSKNICNPGNMCDDCGWSRPSISMTEITGDHPVYFRCDYCGDTMRDMPCWDCYCSEGVPDDE